MSFELLWGTLELKRLLGEIFVKKKFVVLLFILIIIGSTGCNNKKSEKNIFIEKVKILETNEFKLDALEITYDEFKENVSNIFPQKTEKYYLEKKDNTLIFDMDSTKLYIKDLEDISEEELNSYRKMLQGFFNERGFEKLEQRVEISDENYEGTFDGEKRVYSKKTRTLYFADTEPVKELHFTMYDFKKVDDEWMISNTKSSFVRKNMDIYDKKTGTLREPTEEEFKKVLASTAFTPENNNKIKYVESINFTVNLPENKKVEEPVEKNHEIVSNDEPKRDYLEEYKLIDPDLEVDEELQLIYNDYKETFDDELLRDLQPIDIFRINNKAIEEGNIWVEANLIILPPDIEKEIFIEEIKNDSVSMKNSKEALERYKNFEGEVIITVLNENTTFMRIGEYEGLRFKKTDEGIWKFDWLARQ